MPEAGGHEPDTPEEPDGPTNPGAGVLLCPSTELGSDGRAFVFDALLGAEPVRAFVLRHEGHLVSYLNRCVHQPVEMDWQPGMFLDAEQRFIVCSMHGAHYDVANGRCAGGPCGRGALRSLSVRESGGQVYWYPQGDLQPLNFT